MNNIGGFDASDVAGRLSRYLPNAPTTGPSGVSASDSIGQAANQVSSAYDNFKDGISQWYHSLTDGMRGGASNPAVASPGAPGTVTPSGAPVPSFQPNPPTYQAPLSNPGTVITQASTTKSSTSWWYWLLLILILVVIGYIIWKLAGGGSTKSATGNVPIASQPVYFTA
jgi:hypothetical protein